MYYIDEESNQQLPRLKKLGINTEGQTFEQMINTLITMVEESKCTCNCQGSESDCSN